MEAKRTKMLRLSEDTICPVCFVELRTRAFAKVLPCGHGFHGHCINYWVREKSHTCPMCRATVPRAAHFEEYLPSSILCSPSVFARYMHMFREC